MKRSLLVALANLRADLRDGRDWPTLSGVGAMMIKAGASPEDLPAVMSAYKKALFHGR